MRALGRFVSMGLRDADARVAAAVRPRSPIATDNYLRSSVAVSTVDALTRYLHDVALASSAMRAWRSLVDHVREQDWQLRYEALALVLLAAVVTHIVLTLANGLSSPGWFGLIVPAMAATLAVVLLVGSRSSSKN